MYSSLSYVTGITSILSNDYKYTDGIPISLEKILGNFIVEIVC